MIDGECPILATHVLLRMESSGYIELPLKLCGKPSVWPTSCATTNCTSRPINESGNGNVCARLSRCPTCEKYQLRCRSMMLWYIWTSASMISPVRGSVVLGPTALATGDGSHRTIATDASSPEKSGSFGAVPATIPLAKPACSNAGCHSSMPARTHGMSHAGVAGST